MNPTTTSTRKSPLVDLKSTLLSKGSKRPQTKIEKISDEQYRSHLIKVTPVGKEAFHIPVVDVRDGKEQREAAMAIIKESNKARFSQYMKPSFTGLFGDTYN